MTDKTQLATGDKVWAMCDHGATVNVPSWAEPGVWYEVEDSDDGQCFKGLGRVYHYRWCDGPWHRHVGPTPPDAQAMPDTSPVTNADGWIPHDGSPDRPKGVGKRDVVETGRCYLGVDRKPRQLPASDVYWQYVTRYRIITRAPKKEKRRKVWVLQAPWTGTFEVILDPFGGSAEYVTSRRGNGYKLYIAKLKEVTE